MRRNSQQGKCKKCGSRFFYNPYNNSGQYCSKDCYQQSRRDKPLCYSWKDPRAIAIVKKHFPVSGVSKCETALRRAGFTYSKDAIRGKARYLGLKCPHLDRRVIRTRRPFQPGDWDITPDEIYRRAAAIREERHDPVAPVDEKDEGIDDCD